CPYHGWTYRLDGALRHRLHAEAFDRDCGADAENLVLLPCEERHGLLWVVPTPGAAIDVAGHLGGLDGELSFFAIDKLSHFRSVSAEYPANWKLIVDAFLEAYHIRVLHRDTIYPFFADGLTAGERFGPHIQSLVARREGEAWARQDNVGDVPESCDALCRLVTPSHVIFPNTITIFHPDYLSLVTLYPVSAGILRWMHRMLIPAARATADWAPHWEKTFRLIEEGVFQKEDIACAVGIQSGLASGANRFLTAGRAEQALGWFHADVAARLGED
ncbi:MAG: aromatic ring-hydroxylating dioxygenase subunit alpha, partial [Pseudomonadota bacterium]|nr:aromatic ring-hydroxylating dioxygenase subunit alpha [Pseudomonadota bacterium]